MALITSRILQNIVFKVKCKNFIMLSGYLATNNKSYLDTKKHLFTSSCYYSEKRYEKPGFKITKVVTEDGVVTVKKKVFEPRITLLSPDDSMQILTLEEANKIARRRNLKLLKISDDPKTDRPVYKLLSIADFAEEKKKDRGKTHGNEDKLLMVNSKISEHDLQSKIRHILKWLEKDQPVKVVISGDASNLGPAEKIYDLIVAGVKDSGRIGPKVSKHGELKFQIHLPKKPKIKAPKVESTTESEQQLG